MKTWQKALSVITLVGMMVPAALADHHRHWHDDWRNDRDWRYQHGSVVNQYNAPGYRYNQWSGSYINSGVGADGYPAWMGGYRPGLHR